MKYAFHPITECKLCGSGSGDHKVLGRRLDRRQGLFPRSLPGLAVTVLRCRRCGLIFPNPLPLPEQVSDHYGVAPEAYWDSSYFVDDPQYLAWQIGKFLKYSGKQPAGLRALDIGAGIGKGMKALARAGFDAHGIEVSASFREAAITRNGIAAANIQLAGLEEASFPDGSFDFITFLAVLEHLSEPGAALRKIVRWLKPDGLLVVEVPSSDYLLYRLVRRYYRLTGNDFVPDLSPMHRPYHLYQFTRESFLRHGLEAGYEVAAWDCYACQTFLPRWLGFASRPLQWLMQKTATGMELEVWLRRRPGAAEPLPAPAQAAAALPVVTDRRPAPETATR
jgi:SAM-dependent methyltransferase